MVLHCFGKAEKRVQSPPLAPFLIMNLLSATYGPQGNAKCKRARRGMEKDWNRYDEPVRKLMKHGDSMKKSKRWVQHKEDKEKYIE